MPVVALPAIAVVLIALVAALLLFAAPAFVKLIQETVGQLPVVGSAVGGALTSAFGALTSTLMAWANAAVGAGATFVFGVVSAIWSIPAAATDALGSALATVARLSSWAGTEVSNLSQWITAEAALTATLVDNAYAGLSSWIIAEAGLTIQYMNNAIAAAEAYANNIYAGLSTWIQAEAAATVNLVNGALASAETYADNIYAGLSKWIQAEAAATASMVAQAEAQAAADLSNAVGGLENYAQAAASGAAATLGRELDQAAHDILSGPWEALLGDLGVIATHLPAGVAQAIPGLSTIPQAVPTTLPGVLSILSTAVAAIGAETSSCTVPMCENMGGLSSLLGGLEDAAIWAALVALTVEAVHDPGAAATAIRSDVAPVVNGASQAAMSLLGV